jgi:hypothetical protein
VVRVYLLYLEVAGQETTDTDHEAIEAALRQAHWEFGVTPEEWEIVEEDPEI